MALVVLIRNQMKVGRPLNNERVAMNMTELRGRVGHNYDWLSCEILYMYSWLSLSRTRLTRISGWVKFLSKSRTSLCINIYNLTPVESNSDESKFLLSRIKVLVPRCRKPYYLHSLSQIYMSKHVHYLRIKIGPQVKYPVIEFDIFTLGYFTCLFHNLSN